MKFLRWAGVAPTFERHFTIVPSANSRKATLDRLSMKRVGAPEALLAQTATLHGSLYDLFGCLPPRLPLAWPTQCGMFTNLGAFVCISRHQADGRTTMRAK